MRVLLLHSGLRVWCFFTTVAWIAAGMWVSSLAWELLHAIAAAENKKEIGIWQSIETMLVQVGFIE